METMWFYSTQETETERIFAHDDDTVRDIVALIFQLSNHVCHYNSKYKPLIFDLITKTKY